MRSFEDELAELLDARAERVVVRDDGVVPALPDDDGDQGLVIENVEFRRSVVKPAEGEKRSSRATQWALAAAAALAVVVGIAALTRGGTDSPFELDVADTDAARADEATDDFADATIGEGELIVWLEPDADSQSVGAIENVLEASEIVDAVRYINRAETFAEFEQYWEDEPEILAAVEPEQLPTSFRVVLDGDADPTAVADLVGELVELAGVRDVAGGPVNPAPQGSVEESAPPLYVLPPAGYLSMELDGSESSTDQTRAIDSVVVGRPTDTGFTDLVIIELTAERGFLSTSTEAIGGRTVEPSTDGNDLVAEQLDDRKWLRYTSYRDADLLDIVVPATTVDDGRIVFVASDGFELLTSASPGATAVTTTAVLGDRGPELILSTSVDASSLALFDAAFNSADVDRFENERFTGYFGRPSASSTTDGMTLFSWRITDDHVASILMRGSDEAILAVAEGVRVVDRATWAAAVFSDDETTAAAGDPADVEELVADFVGEPPSTPTEVVVWMDGSAADTDESLEAVNEVVMSLGLTAAYRSPAVVASEIETWAAERGLGDVDTQSVSGLPSAFTVTTDDPVTLAYSVGALPGVQRVNVHPAWSSAPLYLLPPEDVSLDGVQGFADSARPAAQQSATGELMAVGRPTADGFDRLMAVAILSGPEYDLRGETVDLDGRDILVFADAGDPDLVVATEQLPDGRWLHYYLNELDELRSLAGAITLGADGLRFESFDGVIELSSFDGGLPGGQVVGLSPSVDADEGFSITANVMPDDIGLILLATMTDAVRAVTVRGQSGFTVTGLVEDDDQGDRVVWWEPTGHTVWVATSEVDGAVDLAESLVAVDEATWRAAVPDQLSLD